MTAPPFCNACGARFENDDRFCANCGAGRPLTHPMQETAVSEVRPYASRWEANERSTNPRPYTHIAPHQQLAAAVDEQFGWWLAIIGAILPAILIAVYLGTQRTDVPIPGSSTGRTVTIGTSDVDIVAAEKSAFLGFVIIRRGFFALLNIERSLRSR